MKKVIVAGISEQVEFICDSCKKEAYGCLQFSFWYGSKRDMTQANIHLCDDCAKTAISSLNSSLNISMSFVDITEL